MSPIIRSLLVVVTLLPSVATSQDDSAAGRPTREFLRPIDAEKRSALMERHALDIMSMKYFARSGKFEIYEFDIDVLETQGEIITITPFHGPSIEILSNGIERDPEFGWIIGMWSGEFKIPSSNKTYPIEWDIGTWSKDAIGKIRAPDPNREITLSQIERGSGVYTGESYLRRNEKLVYAIIGNLYLPDTRTTIEIRQLKEDLEFLIFYEVDEEKEFILGDDTAVNGPDLETELGREELRRIKLYEAHVDNIKRE